MLRNNNNLTDKVFFALARQADENPYLRQVVRTSIPSADCVEVHLRGKEISHATKAMVASAEKEVLIQLYGLDHDTDAGLDLKEALIHANNMAAEKERRVSVKILVNFRRGPAAFFTKTKENPFKWIEHDDAGVFITLNGKKNYLHHLDIQPTLHEHYFFDSSHTKQIIVDREKIMVRSCDIHFSSNYRDNRVRWTDVATTITAPHIAEAAARSFEAKLIGAPCKNKSSYVASKGGIPVLLLEKENSTDPSKRFGLASPLKFATIECIRTAKRSVKIATANLNDDEIIKAIIDAVNRDVKVTLITGEHHNDDRESKPFMGGTNTDSVKRLFDSLPVSKWDNLQVHWPHPRGTAPKLAYETALHTKLAIVDDGIVLTGSTPLDKQGTYNSAESDVMIESMQVAELFLTKVFNPLLASADSNHSFQLNVLKYSLRTDITEAFANFDEASLGALDRDYLLQAIAQPTNFLMICVALKNLITSAEKRLPSQRQFGLFCNRKHVETLRNICEEHHIDLDPETKANSAKI